jgi:nucleotide-binding universal stress UspA family protein
MEIKHIIVPVDFSENSEKAALYAYALAEKFNATIVLLNAIFIPPASPDAPAYILQEEAEVLRTANSDKLKAMAEKYATQFSSVKSKTHISISTVAYACKEAAENHTGSMIIMGTQGASGIKKVLLGSNTADVAENAQVPVLAIPSSANAVLPLRIMIASDYFDQDIAVAEEIIDFAKKFDAIVYFVHITEGDDFEKEILEMFEKKIREKNNYQGLHFDLANGVNILEGIESYAQKNNIDLVVSIKRKRNFFEKFFSKSITRQMLFHTNIPVFSIPMPDKKENNNGNDLF